jgi:hypothetical protein
MATSLDACKIGLIEVSVLDLAKLDMSRNLNLYRYWLIVGIFRVSFKTGHRLILQDEAGSPHTTNSSFMYLKLRNLPESLCSWLNRIC